jgi:hypothetical protein
MVSADDLDGIRGLLAVFVTVGLEGRAPRTAAELELLALDGIGPFAHPDMPDEVLALFPEALAARGDELAAGILAALAKLAPPRLAALAAAERDRLARDGIASPLADGVGLLQARECCRFVLGDSDAQILGVLLQRPGERKAQAAGVILEREPCGDVVVDGILGEPDEPASVRRLLGEPDPHAVAEPIDAGELADTLGRALAHMVEHELELPAEVLPPLLVLRRALGRDWPLPRLGIGEEAEELLRADADELADAFAAAHGDEAAAVADAMCQWKVDSVGGFVGRWTVVDVEEFLLDWYPRKGGAGGPVETVPDHVIAFLRFLADGGRLDGDDLESLEDAVNLLRRRFESAARDPRNWSPAKALVMQMRAEGVDPMDEASVARWTADFNARPFEQRDRVLGPSLPRPASRGTQRRKAQRRSAKAARKRNRR